MEKKVWPGDSDEEHPEVFTKIPPQPKTKKPGQLTKEQLEQFFNEGYVIINDFFDIEKDLEPLRRNIDDLVDHVANKLYNGGKIKSLYKEFGFHERMAKLEEEFPGANVIFFKLGELPQAARGLWTNPRLLNIVEQLLGTQNIVGNPVWNLRPKTPNNEITDVPWHQDSGYMDSNSYKILIPTAWIPLLDATYENGCLQMVKGGHRLGKIASHQCCYGDTWYITLEKEEIERTLGADMERDVMTCPVKYGGFVLFNNMIPHRSLCNTSSEIRWSMDLRWQRADVPDGFYGLKAPIEMRREGQEDIDINWTAFDSVNRNIVSMHDNENIDDEFDTTMHGPWMDRWEINNKNRHTEARAKVLNAGQP